MVRLKQRYLLLELLYPCDKTTKSTVSDAMTFHKPTPNHIDPGRFVSHVRSHVEQLFGDYGVGVSISSLKVIYLSTATSTVILRVPRNHHRLIWAALSCMTELPPHRKGAAGEPCIVRVVRVSGTIRKAEEELLRRARQQIVRAKLGEDENLKHWVFNTTPVAAASVPDLTMQMIESDSEEALSD